MLSRSAVATLSFLRTLPTSVACERCIGAYLRAERLDVLKIIRELIEAGRILCQYAECPVCRERDIVAEVRRERAA
jgi:hypothetical protein